MSHVVIFFIETAFFLLTSIGIFQILNEIQTLKINHDLKIIFLKTSLLNFKKNTSYHLFYLFIYYRV